MRGLLAPIGLALAVVALVQAQDGNALGATFVVTKTADTADGSCNSDCSLREAIIAANTLPGADAVSIPAGTYTLTIEGLGDEAALSGDLDVTDDVSIRGADPGPTIIRGCDPGGNPSCRGVDRIFHVDPAASGIIAEISELRIERGDPDIKLPTYPHVEAGAGIYNNGHLTIDRLLIQDNIAGTGGGVYSTGSLHVEDTGFLRNGASHGNGFGGGIYNSGDAYLLRVGLLDNGAGFIGGAIYNGGSMEIQSSSVAGSTSGGGIGSGGTLVVDSSDISLNVGAGIRSTGGLYMTNSRVTQNTDIGVTAGFLYYNGGATTASLDSVTLSGNSLGLYVGSDATAELSNATITSNGEGLLNFGVVHGERLAIANNSQGGIVVGHASTSLTSPILTVRDAYISGNSSNGGGGGLYNEGGVVSLTNVTISGNTASDLPDHADDGLGGAIRNDYWNNGPDPGTITIVNATITENAADNGGGGIWNEAGAVIRTLNTVIAGNTGEDCTGIIESQGHNLSSDTSCGFAAPGDLSGYLPDLAPLGDYGGLTLTHALLDTSPAIDAGTNFGCPDMDQREVKRPQDGHRKETFICDIGAFEYVSPLPPVGGVVDLIVSSP